MGFLVLGSFDEHALALLVLQDDVLTLGAEQHLSLIHIYLWSSRMNLSVCIGYGTHPDRTP